MTEIQPFTVEASKAEIDDLRNRLSGTRWPDSETPDDWSQGVPIAYAKEFCEYWAKEYDWSERCDLLNSFAQFITRIDGLDIHFIHVPSPVATARPIVLTHGWPGSVVEFLKVIGPLTDPVPHGGDAADAFHVVCPSLPGYGYSGKPAETGYGVGKIAAMWDQLMLAVGYDGYFAQGGDWGAAVTTAIGMQTLGHCKGIHQNMPSAGPTKDARENPTDEDKIALERSQAYQDWDSGYSKQQSTRPQTLGYGLADSPAGQAMWILEKFWRWTDCQGHPEISSVADMDRADEIDSHAGLGQFLIRRHKPEDRRVERLRNARPLRVHRHPDEFLGQLRRRLGLLRSRAADHAHQRQPNQPTCPSHLHLPTPYLAKRQIALLK